MSVSVLLDPPHPAGPSVAWPYGWGEGPSVGGGNDCSHLAALFLRPTGLFPRGFYAPTASLAPALDKVMPRAPVGGPWMVVLYQGHVALVLGGVLLDSGGAGSSYHSADIAWGQHTAGFRRVTRPRGDIQGSWAIPAPGVQKLTDWVRVLSDSLTRRDRKAAASAAAAVGAKFDGRPWGL